MSSPRLPIAPSDPAVRFSRLPLPYCLVADIVDEVLDLAWEQIRARRGGGLDSSSLPACAVSSRLALAEPTSPHSAPAGSSGAPHPASSKYTAVASTLDGHWAVAVASGGAVGVWDAWSGRACVSLQGVSKCSAPGAVGVAHLAVAELEDGFLRVALAENGPQETVQLLHVDPEAGVVVRQWRLSLDELPQEREQPPAQRSVDADHAEHAEDVGDAEERDSGKRLARVLLSNDGNVLALGCMGGALFVFHVSRAKAHAAHTPAGADATVHAQRVVGKAVEEPVSSAVDGSTAVSLSSGAGASAASSEGLVVTLLLEEQIPVPVKHAKKQNHEQEEQDKQDEQEEPCTTPATPSLHMCFLSSFAERQIGKPALFLAHSVLVAAGAGARVLHQVDFHEGGGGRCRQWTFAHPITALAVDESTTRVCVGLQSGAVYLLRLDMHCTQDILAKHRAPVSSVAFHRQHFVLSASENERRFHVYKLPAAAARERECQLIRRSTVFNDRVVGVACMYEVSLGLVALAGGDAGGERHSVVVVDLASGQMICRLDASGQCLVSSGTVFGDSVLCPLSASSASDVLASFSLRDMLCAGYPSIAAACRHSYKPQLAKELFGASSHAERLRVGAFDQRHKQQQQQQQQQQQDTFVFGTAELTIAHVREHDHGQVSSSSGSAPGGVLDAGPAADNMLELFPDLSRHVYRQLQKREETRHGRIARMEQRRVELEAELRTS